MKKALLILMVLSLLSCNRRQIRETKAENGQLIEQYQVKETKDGSFVKDGFYKTWYSNGQISEQGEYEDNKRNGNFKSWYSNGQMKEDLNYKEDSLDGIIKYWHENGKLSAEGNYEFGKTVGMVRTWYDNGQVQSEKNYDNGKHEGKQIEWYANGQKESEGDCKNGEKDGAWLFWDQDGKVSADFMYKNGKNITLTGSKWLDQNKNTWEFFEDGTYILDVTKNGERRKGNYGLVTDAMYMGGEKFDINFLSKDSISASHWERNFFYGLVETDKLRAKRIK